MKTNKKLLGVVFIFMLAASVVMAGGQQDTAEEQADDGKVKVALLLPGSANDQSWNQLGYDALMTVEEDLGAEVAYSENVGVQDTVAALRDYADRGFDVVFGHGGQYEEGMTRVGPEYPDTHFICIAGAQGGGDNVTSVDNAPWQYGYSYGWMAGKVTESNTVGYITALEGVPTMNNLIGGWREGVKAANPDATACAIYISDMQDVAAAREAALSLVERGADVVQHELNRGTQGVIDVSADKGVYTVARNKEKVERAPDIIMTTTLFDWGGKFVPLVERAISGNLEGGAFFFGFHTPDAPGFVFKYDDDNKWNPDIISDELEAEFQKEVVEMFQDDPIRSYTVEDAKGGCR